MVDFTVPFQAICCEFENPGNNDSGYQSDGKDNRDDADSRIAKTEGGENGLNHLDDQPCRDHVGCDYANDVTTL